LLDNPPPGPEIAHLREALLDLQQRVSALEHGAAATPAPLPPAAPRENIESRFGLTIVNRIGAITLAIGIVFFFKYAVDNEWIGAAGRVLLGLCAGFVLIAAAEWLRRRNQQAFSQGIAGCGLATLYISLYAAFAFYHLFPQPAAFLALIVTSALAIALSLCHGSAAIAALGLAGALLTPVLLHNAGSEPSLDFAYLLLLDAASVAVAIRQRWPVLIPVNALWAIIAAAYLLDERHPGAFAAFALCVAVLHFAAAALARREPKTVHQLYVVGHAAVLIATLRILSLWATNNILHEERTSFVSETGSIGLALYGIVALAAGIARKSTFHRALGLVLLGLVIAKLYLYDVWLLTRFYRISAFVALGVLLLAASYVYSRFKSRTATKPG